MADSSTFNMLLFAAQSSGIAVDLLQSINAASLSSKASNLEQEQLGLQIEQSRLQATEAALLNTRRLNETLATQRVIAGARGQNIGAGSALVAQEKAYNTYNEDERSRQANLGFKETSLKLKQSTSKLQSQGLQSQIFANTAGKALNQVSFNSILAKIEQNKLNKGSNKING